jgi:hypothetical protein
MTTETYDIGDLHQSSIVFYALDGSTKTDPTSVFFTLTKPDGSTLSYEYGTDAELVRDAIGEFHVDLIYDQKGRHKLKWQGTGTVTLAETIETYVVSD